MLKPPAVSIMPPLLPRARVLRPLLAALLAFFWGGWLCGVLYYAGGVAAAAPIAQAGPLFVPLTALLLLLGADSRGEQMWLLLCALASYGVELLGVATGWPFSPYSYTDALGPLLGGVPLSIPAAWLVLCGFGRAVLQRGLPARPAWRWVGTGALWLMGVDLVIDPVATGPLHDWVWAMPGPYYGVPLQNFGGWFLTGALLFALGLPLLPEQAAAGALRTGGPALQPGAIALTCGIAVLLLYSLIALRHGMWVPVLLGLALAGASSVLLRR